MKKVLYIVMAFALLLGVSSCNEWLDVNTNPDKPNNESAPVELRLSWLQHYYGYAWGSASVRTNAACQIVTSYSSTDHIGRLATWNPSQDANITPYQQWFVGGANNVPDLIARAQETGATHYEAAGLVVKSMGYMLMTDMFSEIPYTYAIGDDFSPAHDKGEVVYEGCMADIDRAIELFSKPQETGAAPLSIGDTWHGGDVNKWIKLCYGLKARWMGNLSKTDKYDTKAILDAIALGPQSNADNTKVVHINVPSGSPTAPINGDPFGTSFIWDTASYGHNQKLNRWYVNLLTNYNGTGVRDPRADKLIPRVMWNVKLNDKGDEIVDFDWREDEGLNVQGIEKGWKNTRYDGGSVTRTYNVATEKADTIKYQKSAIENYYTSVSEFVTNVKELYSDEAATINENDTVHIMKDGKLDKVVDAVGIIYKPGAMYVKSVNPLYVEDVRYVIYRTDALSAGRGGLAKNDMNCYTSADLEATQSLGYVQGTGSFYTRPDSDSDLLTYTEMCFLKAEVLFRTGDKGGAYNAYIDGIESHFARMNEKLTYWKGAGCDKTAKGFDVSFAYNPIPQAEIDAYMKSAAVAQSSGDLTMSDIMTQKLIAMGYHYQNWNDVRRFNYNAGNIGGFGKVYTFSEPLHRMKDYSEFSSDPQNDMYYVRRFMQCYLETDYNTEETNKIIAELYGQYGVEKCMDYKVYSLPVWWDWTN